MGNYTQVDQPLRLTSDLGDDELLLAGVSGEEGVSTPFLFELELLSEDGNIDGEALLRTPMRVDVDLPEGGVRSFHGKVRRFIQKGRDRDLVAYRAEIVPWLWFLSLQHDCRIFQGKNVLEIVEEVFNGQGYSDFEERCTREYAQREYCVQYRESNLNFVSRLLEEEGIFYYFEHEEDRHLLVLADDPTAIQPLDGQATARVHTEPTPDEDVVQAMRREFSVHAGEVTLQDYDYLQPSLNLRSTLTETEPEEIYDFPGEFRDMDTGESRTRLELEREEAVRQVVVGHGTCRAFRAGGRFGLTGHSLPALNQEYALLEIRHRARNGTYRAGSSGGDFDYRNEFVAIPHAVPYRPPRRARKPEIRGAQTARVVGPSGEKIWTDSHGRVKLHFHWDRLGGQDDTSSCWVRVSQNWAGKSWGGMFVPHVGHEVIVNFLEGDPDRPIITGRVYHAENPPPQALPANQHKSILEDDYGNEMVFDATPGKEHIRIHSPSHLTTLQLGKSMKFWSESDFAEKVNGSKGWITKGFSMGGSLGFKAGIDVGGSVGIFAGFKLDVEVSEKISMSFGPSFKYAVAKEYSVGKSSYTQHTSKKILLNSDFESTLVGGAADQSVVSGNSRGLTLQYGVNPAASLVKPDIAAKAIVVGTTVAGLVATGVGAALLEVEEDPGAAPILVTVLPEVILGAALVIQKLATPKSESKPGKDLHSTKHATIYLDQTGIEMTAGSASVEVSKDADILAISDAGRVLVGAKSGVVINSDTSVEISAPRVQAKKGLFETKNIKDLN